MNSLPRYLYKPLAPRSIRVLELLPGPFDAPLLCNIVSQLISGTPYDALSYVWGDPTPAAVIKCVDESNGGELGVAKGLAIALVAFRLTDQTRRIWIDALCINQKDITERQSQVRLMGAVYGKAQHVLCWLGPFRNNKEEDTEFRAHLAIRLLRGFNKNPHEHLRRAREHLHFGDDIADTDGTLLESWLAIKELFDLEYFHRAWIIQEVGLAQRARFYWGSKDVWLDWTEVAVFCYFIDNNGASVISHLQLKSWVANHINLVWATDSSGRPTHNFIEVLHWARVHRSTDPRDYIYALLAHPSAKINGSLIMQPDYTLTPAQAFIELALNIIERTNSLQILAFVDHHKEPGVLILPTWVPDWHAVNLVAPLRCSTQGGRETDTSILVVNSEDRTILRCRGVFIDTLWSTSDMIEHSELTVTTREKEMKKKTPFLIDHIWKKIMESSTSPISIGEILASLSLVLTGGYLNESNSTSGENLEQQQSDLAALVLEYERIRVEVDKYSNSFFASLSPKEKALVQTMAARGSAHQFVQDMTWTSMCRKVFGTSKGHIGLGPRIMEEGDICVMLLGATYPMVLRRYNSYYQLVGPALLYGFMNGEAEELSRSGTLLEQGFEII